MREVVAEFKKPVMLHSIGKDSSVMLHLAIKAFYPAPIPFPLMHVDISLPDRLRKQNDFLDRNLDQV
jgi:3'-phosphoadenosine 5'-phosphosulfate sulfotransferase (PAPS reductase)/FAD synthetase